MTIGRIAVFCTVAALTLALDNAVRAQEGGNDGDPAKKYKQSAPDDAFEDGGPLAYYGSENPWNQRMFSADSAVKQPKRRGQRHLLAVLKGRPKRAAEMCKAWLADHPDDQDSLFVLTIAQCQLGDVDAALATMQRALAAGLPIEQFVAGPRELLRPLTDTPQFRQMAAERNVRLVHGPMLGAVTDHSVRIWVRTATASETTIRVYADAESDKPIESAEAESSPESDFTAIVEVDGLAPATQYWYETLVDGERALSGPRPSFHTYPPSGQPARFRVGFGGGAGYMPEHERMWDTIASFDLDAFWLLGDNVYIDLPEMPGPFHRYTYYRRQSRPEFRRLEASTPIYAIWDDHDSAIDDVWLGPYRDRPAWKQPMLAVFRQNWNNPGYGNDEWPACWFRTSIGDVDFFFLDGRFYRTNPFGEPRTMLGAAQKEWLFGELKRSDAVFKVLISPVPWSPNAKPGSHDTWDGFPEEREEIFTWLAENQVDGVFLVAADRHRSDARRTERPNGYPLYEFMSSRLTNVHTHECLPGALFCYNEKCSFGMLAFDTEASDPAVTYTIVNIDGEPIHELTLKRSQLETKP